jgi:hypothetical protein
MLEIENEVKVEEVKPTFNPDDFTTSANKKVEAEPNKEEPKVVDTTNQDAPTVETDDEDDTFEVSFEDLDLQTQANPNTIKKDVFASIKELDPDIDDEDKAVESYKSLKEANKKLSIIAKGRSLIDTDTDIIEWNKMSKMSDQDKAKAKLYFEYKNKGFDHEKAIQRVEKTIEELNEVSPETIEDYAIEYNSLLKRNIEAKTKHIEDSILANNIDLDVEDEVLKNTETAILNSKEFLGMNLPKDETKRAKILKDAGKFANSTEFKKALKDPQTLSKIALFLKYEDNWKNNIKQKGVSKVAMVEKMATAPAVTPSVSKHITEKAKGFNQFNPDGFK